MMDLKGKFSRSSLICIAVVIIVYLLVALAASVYFFDPGILLAAIIAPLVLIWFLSLL